MILLGGGQNVRRVQNSEFDGSGLLSGTLVPLDTQAAGGGLKRDTRTPPSDSTQRRLVHQRLCLGVSVFVVQRVLILYVIQLCLISYQPPYVQGVFQLLYTLCARFVLICYVTCRLGHKLNLLLMYRLSY